MKPRSKPLMAAAAVALAALTGNVAFALGYAASAGGLVTSRPTVVGGVAAAAPADAGTTLVATLDNDITVVANGTVAARRRLDSVIGDVSVSADGKTFYAGTSLGTVYTLDTGLRTTATLTMPDSVVAVRPGPDGQLVVAHGAGSYGQNSTVDVYPSGTRQPTTRQATGATVTGLDVSGDQAVYGTINGRVGMLNLGPAGGQTWQVTLPQPVTSVALAPARGWVLIGDKDGDVTLLDLRGQLLGTVDIGQYPVTALEYDAGTDQILAGDQYGTLHVLDSAGHSRAASRVAGSLLRAFVPDGPGHYLVLPQTGAWSTVDATAAPGVARARVLRSWWIVFDAALLVAVLAALATTGRRRAAVTRAARRIWRARMAYGLVAPTILLVTVFTFYPALSAFYYSFTNLNLRTPTAWVGVDNYRAILTHDSYFWIGVKNMLLVVIASFIKTVTVPLLAAELVHWLRNAFHRYLFRTLFVLSAVVPSLVLTLLWRQVYDPSGLLNSLLNAVGLGFLRHGWLGDDSTALWAVIASGFPYLTAFPFLIFLGGLLTISPELYDSVAIDGAGRWRRLRHIDLPHLRPQFRIVAFFTVVGSVEGFASIFILTNGGPGNATYVPALEMYARIGSGELGYASAIGVVLFLVIVVATMFILRFRRSALEVDA